MSDTTSNPQTNRISFGKPAEAETVEARDSFMDNVMNANASVDAEEAQTAVAAENAAVEASVQGDDSNVTEATVALGETTTAQAANLIEGAAEVAHPLDPDGNIQTAERINNGPTTVAEDALNGNLEGRTVPSDTSASDAQITAVETLTDASVAPVDSSGNDPVEAVQEASEAPTAIPQPVAVENAEAQPANEAAQATVSTGAEALEAAQNEVTSGIKSQEDTQKKAVLDQIKQVAQNYGVTVQDIVDSMGGIPSKRKGVKVNAKYRDPQTGKTWTGRGKEPLWIRGKNRAEFLIA